MTKTEAINTLAKFKSDLAKANRVATHLLGQSEGHDNGVTAGVKYPDTKGITAAGFFLAGLGEGREAIWDREDFDAARANWNAEVAKQGKSATPRSIQLVVGCSLSDLSRAKTFFGVK